MVRQAAFEQHADTVVACYVSSRSKGDVLGCPKVLQVARLARI